MSLETDDASTVEGAMRQAKPIQPRRRRQIEEDDSNPESKPVIKGGWGEEQSAPEPTSDIRRLSEDNHVESLIPDLDEVMEEEAIQEVAHAPSLPESRVQKLSELESNVAFSLPVRMQEGAVDLTPLTSVLVPFPQVVEADEQWDRDKMFLNVLSDILAESEEGQTESNPEESEVVPQSVRTTTVDTTSDEPKKKSKRGLLSFGN